MSVKIPKELFDKVEEQKFANRVAAELGLEVDYKKGNSLTLYHDNLKILDLACDSLRFRISRKPSVVDNVCLIEDKKVMWRFCNDYAKKVLHLFSDDLENLQHADIQKDKQLKKNVNMVKIFCSYDDFDSLEPKMENICRGVEALQHQEIGVKTSERVKARKFVEDKLDSDATVLCLYSENEHKLHIFAKTKDSIVKAEKEFNGGHLKMTGQDKKGSDVSVTKTTVMETDASSFTQPRASQTEPKNKDSSSFVETRLFSKSMLTSQNTVKSDGADKEGSSLKMSVRDGRVTYAQPSSLDDTGTKSSKRPSKDGFTKDMSESRKKFSAKGYSAGYMIGTGSNFRYEFDLNELKVFVYKNSIVEVKGVDAIVNAANENMVHGGGVAYYISKAAGKQMDDEGRQFVSKNGKVMVGDNCVTSAGNLQYEGIIHAVGPQWCDYVGRQEQCAKDLYKTVKSALQATRERKWRRLALCAISAGIYGVPKELCAEMYIKALADFSDDGPGSLKEVHFVDVNLEILGLVKDAHQKWCLSPDNITFTNALNYPCSAGRKLSNNAASTQSRSYLQYMSDMSLVTFTGQSTTKYDGSPVFEFRICGTLELKLYTGDLVKLDCVDAIVCAVNEQLKGGLAGAVARAGGPSYQQDLQNAHRRKKTCHEGEIIISNGGLLPTKKVMHILIIHPASTVNTETLTRLKFFNQKILEEANFNAYRRIGMPLIGAGLLNSRRDIEACCQQFAKDVLEYCNVNDGKLRIFELHVVSQDARRTSLLRDAFQALGSQSKWTSLLVVKDKERSTRSSNKYGTSNSDREITKQPLPMEKTLKETNPKDSMKPLGKKGCRCTYFDSCGKEAKWTMNCGHMFCSECKIGLIGMTDCFQCFKESREEAKEMTGDIKSSAQEYEKTCAVCLSEFTDPVKLSCTHQLCKLCLDQLKQHKPCCPLCSTAFGIIKGTQPKGTMEHKIIEERLPGFEKCNTIMIIYDFPGGKQGREHPKPGKYYKGTQRHAFLPNNEEGNVVLRLLKVAFDRRLIFTIGDSRTTGKEDRVTWNDIHHKTAVAGGPENFGYPDPDYLTRVKEELALKDITEDCLK